MLSDKQKEHLHKIQIGNIGRKPSEKQLEALKLGRRVPRSAKQVESARKLCRELGKRPKTEAQIEHCRRLGKHSKTKKQLLFGDIIVKHHNDLCHGQLRPNDITLMTNSEHMTFHANLRMKNGTHPFIDINAKKAISIEAQTK